MADHFARSGDMQPELLAWVSHFAMARSDPAETWDLVAKFPGGKEIIPVCNLFRPAETRGNPSARMRPTRAGMKRQ